MDGEVAAAEAAVWEDAVPWLADEGGTLVGTLFGREEEEDVVDKVFRQIGHVAAAAAAAWGRCDEAVVAVVHYSWFRSAGDGVVAPPPPTMLPAADVIHECKYRGLHLYRV